MNKSSDWSDRSKGFWLQIASPLVVFFVLTARSAGAADLSAWRVISIPGATEIEAQGINDAGQVVGTYFSAADNIGHGFLRNKDGSITTINLDASEATAIYGINNLGQMVGKSTAGDFIRQPDGTIEMISVGAFAINDLGQLAGVVSNGGFVTAADGSVTVFNIPGSVSYSTTPLGLNNSGETVGDYGTPTGLVQTHGFLRDSDGNFTTIDVPNATLTVAAGIDDSGHIVGYYGASPASYPNNIQYHGFIRDIDGAITTFDAPFFGSTKPNGISSSTGFIASSFSRNGQNVPPNLGLVRSCVLCP